MIHDDLVPIGMMVLLIAGSVLYLFWRMQLPRIDDSESEG